MAEFPPSIEDLPAEPAESARSLRVERSMTSVLHRLRKFIHDKEAVDLFDQNIAAHFEFAEDAALQREHPYSIRKAIESGSLAQGFDLHFIVGNYRAAEVDVACVDRNKPCPEGRKKKTVAYQETSDETGRQNHRMYIDADFVDEADDEELEKALLHEIAHMIADGMKTKFVKEMIMNKIRLDVVKNNGVLTPVMMNIDDEVVDQCFLICSRNEELFCDGVSDFAMPEIKMAHIRNIWTFNIQKRAFEQIIQKEKKEPTGKLQQVEKILQEMLQKKELMTKNLAAMSQIDERNTRLWQEDGGAPQHPSLVRFHESGCYLVEKLQPHLEKKYLNDLYDTDTEYAQQLDSRFGAKPPTKKM